MPQHSSHVGVFYCMKYKDWSDFKVFCSDISRIIGQPQGYRDLAKQQRLLFERLSAKEELSDDENEKFTFLKKKRDDFLNPPVVSETAKGYLIEHFSKERYGIRRCSLGTAQLPATAKGFGLEREGIKLLSKIDGIEYQKSTEVLVDDHFIGVCDVLCKVNNVLIDIKSSWNAASFMSHKREAKQLSTELWAQMQGYLHLYGLKKGFVCFVLVNTPPHLIEQEKANAFKRYVFGEMEYEKYEAKCKSFDSIYDFNRIPMRRRVIRAEVDYCPEFIEKAKRKVELSRIYLNEFEKSFMSNKNIITSYEDYITTNAAEENNSEHNPGEPLSSDEG